MRKTGQVQRFVRGPLAASLFLTVNGLVAYASEDASIEALIARAGNASTEEARLDFLERLRAHPDLDARVGEDVDRMIAGVKQWLADPRLGYFGKPIRETEDYDFGIGADSPVYPLTYLYRGRMLTWAILEYGGFGNPERWAKARGYFEAAHAAFPGNPIVGMYLGDAIPADKTYAPTPGAPAWAEYQREALERLTDIIHWWIEHRMREDGQYGGGWGDDCEMWRWWVPILLGFEDPKVNGAQATLSNALMSQAHMRGGYTSHLYDVEHTAEDSSDVMTPMMHLEPDNPVWRDRALGLANLFEHLWTGVNARGQVQFKSTYFNVERVDEDPAKACDTVYHPRAVQPTLLHWQRTGDEHLGKLFSSWMDTWVAATARAERGKPGGIVPSALHWPDGGIGGVGREWWDPRNHGEAGLYRWPSAMGMMTHTMLLTSYMTGDAGYVEPIRTMAAARQRYLEKPPKEAPEPGSEAWCAAGMGSLSSVLGKYRWLTGKRDFDELLARDPSPYMAFRLGGDVERLTQALQDTAESMQVNMPGYTSEVRYTDRVLRFPSVFSGGKMTEASLPCRRAPATSLLYSTATGDPGDALYFPLNAVRWRTPPRDIAALVTGSSRDGLTAQLLHFGEATRDMAAEVYLLQPGEYTLKVTPVDASGGGTGLQEQVRIDGPGAEIAFSLPPRRLCMLTLQRVS